MSKDIVVFIPSRSSPEKLNKTIEMLYSACSSMNNFDIVCIVDNDETTLYSSLKLKHKNIIWYHPPHVGPNSKFINKIIFDFVEQNNYYFNWYVADDFYGLCKDWDLKILSRKDIFSDGYYSLYATNPMGRNLNALASQFRKAAHWRHGVNADDPNSIVSDPVSLIYHYHDLMPICTKEWRRALKMFYEQYQGPDWVLASAALSHILSVEHGYSRMIQCKISYEGITDNFNAARVSYKGMTRDQYYYKFAQDEEFALVRPVADYIAQEIWQHHRDIMDEPRKIGKYATK